jgi:thiol-disulfide isomerase/thioredoxin
MYRSFIPMQPSSPGMFSTMTAGSGMGSNTLLIVAALVLFSIVALVCYFYYVTPSGAKYQANSERVPHGTNTGNTAELLFFFADWCPHCKTAKPIWNDLKTEYETKTINGYTILFTEIDCSEETPEVERLNNQYSVEGYPTIKLLKDGQVIEYDAKPSRETLTKFLNTVM